MYTTMQVRFIISRLKVQNVWNQISLDFLMCLFLFLMKVMMLNWNIYPSIFYKVVLCRIMGVQAYSGSYVWKAEDNPSQGTHTIHTCRQLQIPVLCYKFSHCGRWCTLSGYLWVTSSCTIMDFLEHTGDKGLVLHMVACNGHFSPQSTLCWVVTGWLPPVELHEVTLSTSWLQNPLWHMYHLVGHKLSPVPVHMNIADGRCGQNAVSLHCRPVRDTVSLCCFYPRLLSLMEISNTRCITFG